MKDAGDGMKREKKVRQKRRKRKKAAKEGRLGTCIPSLIEGKHLDLQGHFQSNKQVYTDRQGKKGAETITMGKLRKDRGCRRKSLDNTIFEELCRLKRERRYSIILFGGRGVLL